MWTFSSCPSIFPVLSLLCFAPHPALCVGVRGEVWVNFWSTDRMCETQATPINTPLACLCSRVTPRRWCCCSTRKVNSWYWGWRKISEFSSHLFLKCQTYFITWCQFTHTCLIWSQTHRRDWLEWCDVMCSRQDKIVHSHISAVFCGSVFSKKKRGSGDETWRCARPPLLCSCLIPLLPLGVHDNHTVHWNTSQCQAMFTGKHIDALTRSQKC